MNEEDQLFLQNPTKAIWLKLKEIDEELKKITNELEDMDDLDENKTDSY